MKTAWRVWTTTLALGLGGCGGGDACAELAAICARCPADGDGLVARASCDNAVQSGDEAACEQRIDDDVYGRQGCR